MLETKNQSGAGKEPHPNLLRIKPLPVINGERAYGVKVPMGELHPMLKRCKEAWWL